jgi:GntR family transcriptional regulator
MLKCSVITIRRVYQDLENEGLLLTRQGTGTFVAKVGDEIREVQRLSGVKEAFESAVDAGLRVQCTEEEMMELLQNILRRKRKAEESPGGGS